jgi:hypothetical protein
LSVAFSCAATILSYQCSPDDRAFLFLITQGPDLWRRHAGGACIGEEGGIGREEVLAFIDAKI